MGTVIAGPGRWQKPRPLETWSARRWRRVEQLFNSTAPTVALRAALCHAVARYGVELGVPDLSPDDIRATATQVAAFATNAPAFGEALSVCRARLPLATRALVELWLPHLVVGDAADSHLLTPEDLACLAQRAQAATRWRFRVGSPGDGALMGFVLRLEELFARYGEPATHSWCDEQHEYRGTVDDLVRLLQPALPGSIATCSPTTLGARLTRARRAAKRVRRAEFPL
jgi:hypothetical protein